ncbi:DegT/DnrJ/EryC1/StrS family aminotransferase [Cryobacterium sp. SO2]|uniref:DegT/DnrJ/EryC1/StrS family aminotransferase n=1 Tax=Cryobacterium sp. SO2 TaxID=1897060 RepID=UPI00223D3A7D|nr:DegT/DnrJ/EryC1/StrS family aminotransferase [Cryobacterium sp. SO2]WEO76932.1 DegT/DnrJ/EryC1/StrS family aminotransferase [Cryobacterium sp. SO2]
MTDTVPFIDLRSQQSEIFDEVAPLVAEILRRGDFIGGRAVATFEEEFAAFCSVSHCIGVGNGTDALELALRALDLTGQEVLVPANSFIASAGAIVRAGAAVRFADIDDDSLLLDGASLERSLGPDTAAVMAVHLYGQPAPIEELQLVCGRAGVLLLEDAAQSQGASRHGRQAGSLSLIAGTSFYPGKNLGAAGDGGAVLTSDDELASRVRRIANHGSARKYVHEEVGFNSRLDTIQAVVLRAKLARLEAWNEARRAAARRYDELLAGVDGVRLPVTLPGNIPNWHIYAIRVAERDRILAGLNDAGIGAALHYPTPIHLTGAFAHLGLRLGDFPVAERAATELLSLPMSPHLTPDQQHRVVEALTGLV